MDSRELRVRRAGSFSITSTWKEDSLMVSDEGTSEPEDKATPQTVPDSVKVTLRVSEFGVMTMFSSLVRVPARERMDKERFFKELK